MPGSPSIRTVVALVTAAFFLLGPARVFGDAAPLQVRALFIGHPVTCDDERVVLNLLEWGDRAAVEAHNPTDAAIETTIRTASGASFMPQARAIIGIEPGTSQIVELR